MPLAPAKIVPAFEFIQRRFPNIQALMDFENSNWFEVLEDEIHTYCGAIIESEQLSFGSPLVRGITLQTHPVGDTAKIKAKIIIDADLDDRDYLFVRTKELCHVILFHEGNFTEDLVELVQYVSGANLLDLDADIPRLDAENELLAQLAAFELLFPHTSRAAELEKLAAGTTTIEQIAEDFLLSVDVVTYILGPRHLAFATEAWALV